jgi:hypothetical protein
MPNAKCDKCHQYLQDICINNKQKLLLINLIKLRAKKKFGIVYNIHPGITHDEINPDNNYLNGKKCNGLLWYEHFRLNPKGFENIDLSKIIFNSDNIEEIENRLIDNISNSQIQETSEYSSNEDTNIIKGVVSLNNEVLNNQGNNYKTKDENKATCLIRFILFSFFIYIYIVIFYLFFLLINLF